MYYFESVTDDNNYTYSCDSIRLEFNLSSSSELLTSVCDFCYLSCDKHYMSFKTFSYRYVFTVYLDGLDASVSFSILVGLNLYSDIKSCVVVDFNPNKCMHFKKFRMFMLRLFDICHNFYGRNCINDVRVKRYDVAIDIPCERRMLSVAWNGRGARRHETVQTTIDDKTEYFGERNASGRIKIYNKSLEDIKRKSLREREDYRKGKGERLTRIEVTHDTNDVMVLYSAFPSAFTRYDVRFLPDSFSQTDYILVQACVNSDDCLRRLKTMHSKWSKLKDYINPNPICYDIDCLDKILFQIICYTEPSMYGASSYDDLLLYFKDCVYTDTVKNFDFPQEKLLDGVAEYEELQECEALF